MPMLGGRPLLDNRSDIELFIGRGGELRQLNSAVQSGLNTLIVSEPGLGKTSLLRSLMYRLRTVDLAAPSPQLVELAYVRGEGATDPVELLRRTATAVLGAGPIEPAGVNEDMILRLLAERERAGIDLILLDDVTAAAGHGLFGRLRDQLWELGCVWVVATRVSERGGLLLPPADAFFERVLELGPLSTEEVAELLQTRLGSSPNGWAERLADVGGGNPRRILDMIRELTDDTDRGRGTPSLNDLLDDLLDAVARRNRAIAALGRPEAMLAGALDSLGAASASDEVLLSQLGWTRPRAVQVLTRLETAGLVRSADVRLGPGRPRKVFRLTPPADYVAGLAGSD
jgi:hypothetical protein